MTIATFGAARTASMARRAAFAMFNIAVTLAVVVLIVIAVVRTTFGARPN